MRQDGSSPRKNALKQAPKIESLGSFDQSRFEERCLQSLGRLIRADAQRSLWIAFLCTYRRRATLPWLGESGRFPGRTQREGLTYAFRYALCTWDPNLAEALDHEAKPFDKTTFQYSQQGFEDEKSYLYTASQRVFHDPKCAREFAAALKRAGYSVDALADDPLQKLLQSALEVYAIIGGRADLSSTPW